jgi:hypothetical protein
LKRVFAGAKEAASPLELARVNCGDEFGLGGLGPYYLGLLDLV